MDTLTTLENSLVYLVVLAGGYALKRLRVLKKEDAGFLSALIMNVTLPAAVLKGAANASCNYFSVRDAFERFAVERRFLFFKGKAWPGTRLDDSQCEHLQQRQFCHSFFVGSCE